MLAPRAGRAKVEEKTGHLAHAQHLPGRLRSKAQEKHTFASWRKVNRIREWATTLCCVANAVTPSCARCNPKGSASAFWRSSTTSRRARPTAGESGSAPLVASSSACPCYIESTDQVKRSKRGGGSRRSYPGWLPATRITLNACRRSCSLSVRPLRRSRTSSASSALSSGALESVRASRAADAI